MADYSRLSWCGHGGWVRDRWPCSASHGRLRAGQRATREGVVWAFPPTNVRVWGDSLGRDGCSSLFSLVSDLLRS